MYQRSEITLRDGTVLRYIDEGAGPAILILPGLSSSVAKFEKQVDGLRDRFRVIALDPRGHGESDAPPRGYDFPTLARDLHEFLTHLAVDRLTVLGHSAACKIVLTYWEIYDGAGIARVVLSDDAPACVADGAVSEDEAAEVLKRMEGPDGDEYRRGFSDQFLSEAADQATRDFFVEETLKMPTLAHAKLLRWALYGDWWDAVPLIDVPALIIGGRASKNPWQNMVRIHEAIPQSDIVIFEEHEGGGHAMYWENPEKYNRILTEFLESA